MVLAKKSVVVVFFLIVHCTKLHGKKSGARQ